MLDSELRFQVKLDGQLDFHGSLEPFTRSGDDQIERWNGQVFVRTMPTKTGAAPYACSATEGPVKAPRLEVTVARASDRASAETAVSSMFMTDSGRLAKLAGTDPVIASLNQRYPGVRPVLQPDPLTVLVRCISAQQVNLQWATTLRSRLAERLGRKYAVGEYHVYSLDAERLASAQVADLRALQFSTVKSEALISLADSCLEGSFDLAKLNLLADQEVIDHLQRYRGVGRWTAEWFLVRALGRPRVAAGDLVVRKSVGAAYLKDHRIPSEEEVRELTSHWGEAASIAQALLVHAWNHSAVREEKRGIHHEGLRQRHKPKVRQITK